MYKKDAQFTSQALFSIFMLILFIGILVYGYNTLIDVQKDLGDKELRELRQTIFDKTSICAQESQRGRLETIEISNPKITHLCYVSNTSEFPASFSDQIKLYGLTQNHTIFLLNGPLDIDFTDYSDLSDHDQFLIHDIIPLADGSSLSSLGNQCFVSEQNEINFRFRC